MDAIEKDYETHLSVRRGTIKRCAEELAAYMDLSMSTRFRMNFRYNLSREEKKVAQSVRIARFTLKNMIDNCGNSTLVREANQVRRGNFSIIAGSDQYEN